MSKKRKFTFNAIDALIIILLVALIAFVVYYFVLGNDFNLNDEDNTSIKNTENAEQKTINDSTVSEIGIVGYESAEKYLL